MDHLLRHYQVFNSLEAQLLLREGYDESYDIINHDLSGRLSLIEYSEVENVFNYDVFRHYAVKYMDAKIGKYFDLNIDQFLNRPRFEVEELLELAMDKVQKDSETAEGLGEELENALNGRS